MEMKYQPKIVMIPTLLSEDTTIDTLSPAVKTWINNLTYFVVEKEKTARRFIKKIAPEKIQSSLQIQILNKNTSKQEVASYFKPIEQGHSIGVLSEAGCPGIADPGAMIVDMAHQRNIPIEPLVGPSSILLSLMASGLNGQNFSFHGYLPIDKDQRMEAIKKLEGLVHRNHQTQLFIETPYRNNSMIADLIKKLQPETKLCIAVDITSEQQYIKTQTIRQWQKAKYDFHKRPAIFLIGK